MTCMLPTGQCRQFGPSGAGRPGPPFPDKQKKLKCEQSLYTLLEI